MKYRIKSIRHNTQAAEPTAPSVPPVAPIPPVQPTSQNPEYENTSATIPAAEESFDSRDADATVLFTPPITLPDAKPVDEKEAKKSFIQTKEGKITVAVICGFAVLLIALIITLTLINSGDNKDKGTEAPVATEPDNGCTHIYEIDPQKSVPATCTEDGTNYLVCAKCQRPKGEETVPALGHDWEEVEDRCEEATCDTQGIIYKKCKTCSETDFETVPALGHDLKLDENRSYEADCENEGREVRVCQREDCDMEEIEELDALGHDWETVTTEATCTEAGSEVSTCKREGCDATETVSIDPTGHKLEDGVCSVCGYVDAIKDGNSVVAGKGLRLDCGSILTIGDKPTVTDNTLTFDVTMFVTDKYNESPLKNKDITVVCPGTAGGLSVVVSGDFSTDPSSVSSITVPNTGYGDYVITIIDGRTKHTCTYTLSAKVKASVTADYADTELLASGYYYQYKSVNSEYTVQVAFCIDVPVTDVILYSVSYNDDGFEDTVIYKLAKMEASKPLVADLEFPGDMSTYKITFTTSDGESHSYNVYQSGMDGSIELTEE